ncbi:DEAD/DEAH box helicase [Microbacterium sp. HSID17254]|uniref:DEAD/DEAH box helicase n=1 Tax=Microbacterium sp. HSID17254 TaxID=2419509 RepID=UPI000F8911CD|nr:DEAD/DEAH box helicase [Microbacterium sp. HSID17254]RUQ06220.1 DEAD/DEAH box helicase [Microbacterium sp. HSID17254]
MSWPELMDPALQDHISERQSRALRVYEEDHDLLVEHVRQEDSFKSGGYGTRQIPELLQNAVDALAAGGSPGMVEFRLADGALYCANEGAGFDADGLTAVTYAFLSSKRGDEIGRFGLGFKSVLGVSDHPQIYSRSVSFAFNAPETSELFAGIPSDGGRYPLLRVPSVVDVDEARREDQNLAEMMGWATTIVKLPLTREGDRLRKELKAFSPESLLFFKALDRLRITMQDRPGTAAVSRDFRREGDQNDGQVVIVDPEGVRSRWLYAEREYTPTIDVASTLSATALRQSMTISYAVRPEGRASPGQLWAWFPLRDQTTASGIFNAPWQVNDDRTSLIVASKLNAAMLEVGAELFLDVVSRASTADDLGAHLDLFPARGRESRSPADSFLSAEIPRRARSRALIPDVTGALKVPPYFTGVPDIVRSPLTVTAAEIWQERAPRETMPHARCFSTSARRNRLRSLLGGDEEERSPQESGVAAWLTELVGDQSAEGVDGALRILVELAANARPTHDQALSARVIPVESGGWVRADQSDTVLLPVPGAVVPDGVELVRSDVADASHDLLRQLRFRGVTVDEAASALAASATDRWSEAEWAHLWATLNTATPQVAARAVEGIRERGVRVLIRTEAGTWRAASDLVADGSIARDIAMRQIDASIVPNIALRTAAGAFTAPERDRELERDRLRGDYVATIEDVVRRYLAANGLSAPTITVPDMRGVGPLDLLVDDLSEQDRVAWTHAILARMGNTQFVLDVPLRGRRAEIMVSTMEWWAVRSRGLIQTSLGARRPDAAVSGSLRRFSAFLPVASHDAVAGLPLPKDLASVPVSMLEDFLARGDYTLHHAAEFAELIQECARRSEVAVPEHVPAVINGSVVLTPRSEVAIVVDGVGVADLEEAGVAYVPTASGDPRLAERWGLISAEDALHQSVEIVGATEAIPLLDIHPSLQSHVLVPLGRATVARAASIHRVLQSARGTRKKRLKATHQDRAVTVDASLEIDDALAVLSAELELGLTADDVRTVLRHDESLRQSELIASARAARNDEKRLLLLAGADALRANLPDGLLAAVESNTGTLDDRGIAELFVRVHGYDSVRELRDVLRQRGVPVPEKWDGSAQALAAVKNLGFDTSYAGSREKKPSAVSHIQGKLTLNPLHDYQREVADKIGALVAAEDPAGRRGLLYLPTGAGKTRVTVEALVKLMKAGEIESPVLWIAQSEELCEQAIHSFSEVWRAFGDERALDVSRFWSGYELDESDEELHVVVAIDATLGRRLGEPQYEWLTTPGIVVIDEAHTALSKTYTDILRHLGLTAHRTDRPLLGLTATPFRGRNDEINRLFAQRFGENRLESLDPEDPIAQLRSWNVLSQVDYHVLDGVDVGVGQQDAEFRKMKEVTPGMLAAIGQDMQRTLTVVRHIKEQDPTWPILVFAASVASAHTIAALLRLEKVNADSVDGSMRRQHRRRVVEQFKSGETQVLVNCDLLTQGFDAPMVRALYIARPTFSPNRYLQMVGRGLRGPANGGTERCLIVNVEDTFEQFGEDLAYNEFDYLWSKA